MLSQREQQSVIDSPPQNQQRLMPCGGVTRRTHEWSAAGRQAPECVPSAGGRETTPCLEPRLERLVSDYLMPSLTVLLHEVISGVELPNLVRNRPRLGRPDVGYEHWLCAGIAIGTQLTEPVPGAPRTTRGRIERPRVGWLLPRQRPTDSGYLPSASRSLSHTRTHARTRARGMELRRSRKRFMYGARVCAAIGSHPLPGGQVERRHPSVHTWVLKSPS